MHPKASCPRNSKNDIEIVEHQAVFKLWIKTGKALAYLQNVNNIFKFLRQFKMHIIGQLIFKKCRKFCNRAKNMLIFG